MYIKILEYSFYELIKTLVTMYYKKKVYFERKIFISFPSYCLYS